MMAEPIQLTVTPVDQEAMDRYSAIPFRFEVKAELRVEPVSNGLGGFAFTESAVPVPYWKEAMPGEGPQDWIRQWDTSSWACIFAAIGDETVGGAVLARDTPGLDMLEGRRDLSVLWDICVAPERRGHGIGTALFRQTVELSRVHGCRQMKIETQSNNVPACRFYAAMGCTLGGLNRYAYSASADPSVASEVQLLWYLDL